MLLFSGFPTACAFSCRYCYVESMVLKQNDVRGILERSGRTFDRLVIRRAETLRRLAKDVTRRANRGDETQGAAELLSRAQADRWGLRGNWSLEGRCTKFLGSQSAGKVIFASPLVDIAASPELAAETVELCEMLLCLTSFDIRLLSKSPNLASIVNSRRNVEWPVSRRNETAGSFLAFRLAHWMTGWRQQFNRWRCQASDWQR